MSWILGTCGRIGAAIAGRLLLAISVATLIAAAALPQVAAAEAGVGAEPSPGAAGLPDGRVYEEVSPANKSGNEATYTVPAFASPDGQAVLYGDSGTVAEEPSANTLQTPVVSERTAAGWKTRSTMPQPYEGERYPEEYVTFIALPEWSLASADLTHLLFNTAGAVPYVGPPDKERFRNNLFLEGPNPFAEPEWVGRSLIEGAPSGEKAKSLSKLFLAGGSPGLETVYFYYEAPLIPGASGLYEYRDGVLKDAGTMPEGETSAGSAAPAAQPLVGSKAKWGDVALGAFNNEVSADGSRIFFTRTDAAGTLELYAHTTSANGAESTQLVSLSQLPGHVGEPAAHGPLTVATTEQGGVSAEDSSVEGLPRSESPASYVFASPDGTRAFFQSVDRLTTDAPENGAPKSYVLDLDTGQLEYLPWLTGSIVTVSSDGSAVIFENTATSPYELQRWVAGSAGGQVETLAELPAVSPNVCGSTICLGPAFASANGEIVVFATESDIPGFNDGGTHYPRTAEYKGEEPEPAEGAVQNKEVFRYDGETNELSCLSCPHAGITPSANASTSFASEFFNASSVSGGHQTTRLGSPMNAGGTEVFFETREALVPQDTNGNVDVYEWENGKVYLISTGVAQGPSRFMGTSESGEDVFFASSEGIAPGDTDGGRDVYDARVPRPGDHPAPTAVPCTGAVCQGPPSVPNLLSPPASESFNGPGDLTPTPAAGHGGKRKKGRATQAKRQRNLQKALKRCKRRFAHSARKRSRCTAKARHAYGARASRMQGRHSQMRRNRRNNGRGN